MPLNTWLAVIDSTVAGSAQRKSEFDAAVAVTTPHHHGNRKAEQSGQ
jgi:hypothetical protein